MRRVLGTVTDGLHPEPGHHGKSPELRRKLGLSSITGAAMMTRNALLFSVSILWCMSLSIALLYAIL